MVLPNVLRIPNERTTAIAPSTTAAAADVALVRRIAAGDKSAHRELYELHGRAVLVFLACRVDDEAMAEELLQDVMLAVWQTAHRFGGRSAVRTWLFAIAHNTACNALRRRRPLLFGDAGMRRALDARAATPGPGIGADQRLDLQRAMADLPDDQRTAMELFFFHGFDLEEIGAITGAPLGTVKSRLSRAKGRLRRSLAGDGAPEGGSDVP